MKWKDIRIIKLRNLSTNQWQLESVRLESGGNWPQDSEKMATRIHGYIVPAFTEHARDFTVDFALLRRSVCGICRSRK